MIFKEMIELVGKERRKRQREQTAKKLAIGIAAAATFCVAAGVLLAPQSGKETRADLKKKAEQTVDNTKELVTQKVVEVKEKAAKAAQDINDVINEAGKKKAAVSADLSEGKHEIEKDVDYTVGKIYDDLNKVKK